MEAQLCIQKFNLYPIQKKKNNNNNNNKYLYNLYILRQFRKLIINFFPIKNTPKLINQQLKNDVEIVNWQKEVSY